MDIRNTIIDKIKRLIHEPDEVDFNAIPTDKLLRIYNYLNAVNPIQDGMMTMDKDWKKQRLF